MGSIHVILSKTLCTFILFADDIKIFKKILTPEHTISQNNLNLFFSYVSRLGFYSLNIEKCVIVSPSIDSEILPLQFTTLNDHYLFHVPQIYLEINFS